MYVASGTGSDLSQEQRQCELGDSACEVKLPRSRRALQASRRGIKMSLVTPGLCCTTRALLHIWQLQNIPPQSGSEL